MITRIETLPKTREEMIIFLRCGLKSSRSIFANYCKGYHKHKKNQYLKSWYFHQKETWKYITYHYIEVLRMIKNVRNTEIQQDILDQIKREETAEYPF